MKVLTVLLGKKKKKKKENTGANFQFLLCIHVLNK